MDLRSRNKSWIHVPITIQAPTIFKLIVHGFTMQSFSSCLICWPKSQLIQFRLHYILGLWTGLLSIHNLIQWNFSSMVSTTTINRRLAVAYYRLSHVNYWLVVVFPQPTGVKGWPPVVSEEYDRPVLLPSFSSLQMPDHISLSLIWSRFK